MCQYVLIYCRIKLYFREKDSTSFLQSSSFEEVITDYSATSTFHLGEAYSFLHCSKILTKYYFSFITWTCHEMGGFNLSIKSNIFESQVNWEKPYCMYGIMYPFFFKISSIPSNNNFLRLPFLSAHSLVPPPPSPPYNLILIHSLYIINLHSFLWYSV